MAWDIAIFKWINGMVGHVPFLDRLFTGLADDYFMVISMCLFLVAMWFGTREPEKRLKNQISVLAAMASLGIASGLVSWCNYLFVRTDMWSGSWINTLFNRARPFDPSTGIDVNLLFYRPTDPSFPSNLAAVVFGLAFAVWVHNRTAGTWLIILAALACFARVYVGIHFPADVLGGMFFGILGTAITYGLFWLLAPVLRLLMNILKAFHLAG